MDNVNSITLTCNEEGYNYLTIVTANFPHKLSRWDDGYDPDMSFGQFQPRDRSWYFCFSPKQWRQFVDGTGNAFADIGHLIRRDWSDAFTFVDMDPAPSRDQGTMEVKYARIRCPQRLLDCIDRLLRLKQRREKNVRLELDPKRLARICERYGQGTGKVKVVVDRETAQRLGKDILADLRAGKKRGGVRLKNQVRNWIGIARNTTWAFNQTATLHINKDWDGYFVNALRPDGKSALHGGLINHGSREDKETGEVSPPDWSSHT
jgi:hypothetical protein